jgi:hypothetical protein
MDTPHTAHHGNRWTHDDAIIQHHETYREKERQDRPEYLLEIDTYQAISSLTRKPLEMALYGWNM